MLGSRRNALIGAKVGAAVGSAADDEGGASAPLTWSVDAAATRGVPASAAEWSVALAAAGISTSKTPTNLYKMQEASGNLADSVGSLTLAASGTIAYQQAVAGWTRTAFQVSTGVAGSFGVGAGSGPNAGTQSVAMLAYVNFAAPAAERGLIALSTTTNHWLQLNVTTTGLLRYYVNATTFNSVNNHAGAVRPILMLLDRTGSRAVVYSDLEKRAATYSSLVQDGPKSFASASPPSASFLYGAIWQGASAEFSDAEVKALLQTLGWTIPWT